MSFLSGIDLLKHLPDSCPEALKKDSDVLNCSAGHLFFRTEQTGRVKNRQIAILLPPRLIKEWEDEEPLPEEPPKTCGAVDRPH